MFWWKPGSSGVFSGISRSIDWVVHLPKNVYAAFCPGRGKIWSSVGIPKSTLTKSFASQSSTGTLASCGLVMVVPHVSISVNSNATYELS